MFQENDRIDGWYPRASASDKAAVWYAASGDAAEPMADTDAAEERTRRRKKRRVRIIAVMLCAALLLSAGGAAILRSLQQQNRRAAATRSAPRSSSESRADDEEERYDDFREYFQNYYTGSDSVSIPRTEADEGVTLSLSPAEGEELSLQEVYDKVSPAVVGVIALRGDMEYGWGTGVVFRSDGYIVTNTHIISGCDGARVVFMNGEEYEALLIGEDSASDIAVLKIDGIGLPCAEFGESDALRVGDTVAAIGNPLGENYAGTMTNGIISAINRNVMNNGHSMTLLQTNAALNEGNSGGPLVNAYGQVVGITNMKIMSSLYTTVEGIGFAIPSSSVRDVANQLLSRGVVTGQPSIGITAGSVVEEARALYGLPDGVYVASVNEASASGLEVGDVIMEVNGTAVSTVADVNAIKDAFAVGDTLSLTVWRDGAIITLICILIDQADLK